jgi:hypothetical protein
MNIFDENQAIIQKLTGNKEYFSNLYNSREYFIDCSTLDGRLDAYRKCDILRTVLGKSASNIANLKVWALDEDGRQVKTRKANEVIRKLMRPNPKEDFKRWFKKLDSQVKLHGKSYVRKVYSAVFDEYNYYIIPYQYVTEFYDNTTNSLFEKQVQFYQINDGTTSYQLQPSEVHIFYDVVLDLSSRYPTMYGGSRTQSLSEVISTYVIIWEALTEMYGNRGALNLISMGVNTPQMAGLPAIKNEKEDIIKRLSRRFGLRRTQDKNAVISTDAKVSPLNAKMSEMEFVSIIVECKKAIGAAYDVPAPLLDIESSRYKNMTEAIKNAYTNGAIPTAEYFFSEWLQMIGETALPFELKADYSHLEFYQEARKEESIAFQQMANAVIPLYNTVTNAQTDERLITRDEARLKLDME